MTTSEKIDLYKIYKAEYVASKKPMLVETTDSRYLAIDGKGAPGGDEFSQKLGALYSVAYTVKMAKKFAGQDYKVCGLEGLWWGMGENFEETPQSEWQWKLVIRTPDFVSQDDIKQALLQLKKRGKECTTPPKLERINEGLCVQMLHVGPYDQEQDTIQQMFAFAAQQGLRPHGAHHEVYLSDPRRVPPERLRTILRHPVRGNAQ